MFLSPERVEFTDRMGKAGLNLLSPGSTPSKVLFSPVTLRVPADIPVNPDVPITGIAEGWGVVVITQVIHPSKSPFVFDFDPLSAAPSNPVASPREYPSRDQRSNEGEPSRSERSDPEGREAE
jgi:hypothetical protein